MGQRSWERSWSQASFSVESWALGPLSWIYGYGSGLETISGAEGSGVRREKPVAVVAIRRGRHRSLGFLGPTPIRSVPNICCSARCRPGLPTVLHRFLQYFVAVFFAGRVAEEQLGLEGWWSRLAGVLFASFSYFTVGALFTLRECR
jgi:hypothetical protein